ncbi:Gp1ba [Symbiodinium natans]|uniref:Gp1ba protein n=1 Tax=Symbiodinium natans TaxID=878477 RepID=A0A812SAZ3_9DINO|nr:Gp1ba [Symbiodinium natans]
MTAGTAAAEDARTAGKPEVTVEAEAAKAAESAAARAGASTNEAAEAGGEAAVLVAGQATVLTPSLAENAWAIVNGTRCLNWWGDGCAAITERESCLQSRDGSDVAESKGVKVFGQPCVWCGGERCGATNTLCVPYAAQNTFPSGAEVASCAGKTGASKTSAAAQWMDIPAELKAGGFPQRELFFVPKKSQTGKQDPSGLACRGSSDQDASNLDPSKRNYYATWTASTLKECFDICSWKQDCSGVEFAENHSYCEVWNVPIRFTQPVAGYQCYLAYPQSGQPDGIRWKAAAGMSVSSVPEPTSNLSLEMILGGLLLLGILVAAICACRRWKKKTPAKKAKAAKASAKRGLDMESGDKYSGEAVGSGDEMQPLVGAASGLSSPTGSFVSGYGGRTGAWNQPASFSFAGSQVGQGGYEALNQGVQAPADGSQATYLQQLRQWLQDYEAARFRELAQLQANAQARFGYAEGAGYGYGVPS